MDPSFLIASPQMHDPWFERKVVLLCHHDRDGALGLVINRSGEVTLGAVLARMRVNAPLDPDEPVWWGGPVAPGAGFVVWRGQVDAEEGWNLGGEVAVSPSADRLRRLVRDRVRFRMCLGYAGWGPGQLGGEIEGGSWLVADLDPRTVFDTPLDQRYDRALSQLGLTPSTVWMTPIDE